MSDSSGSSSPRAAAAMRSSARCIAAFSAGPATSAARAAAPGSIARRTCVNSINNSIQGLRSSSQRRTSGSNRFQLSSGCTHVPWRGRARSNPFAVSILTASRKTLRLAPYWRHRSASTGKGLRFEYLPDTTATPRSCTMFWVRFWLLGRLAIVVITVVAPIGPLFHERLHFLALSAQERIGDELQRADVNIDGPPAHQVSEVCIQTRIFAAVQRRHGL